ncbi:MAG: 3'(2'),5'-bisphosphate nucleotidase CysQ [Gammaproteobacteria bacterium]|nr:3'(2'),5'-bisphosphate nucleotidase CysQ [Gammaproteobacteria bacterium]
MQQNLAGLIEPVIAIADRASDAILDIYNSDDFGVELKGDDSPLTKADQASHNLIVAALAELTPDIPILSEESKAVAWEERSQWPEYWLIDPLDGTKEFIKRNGEFTVNIALIQGNAAVLGVVHVPVQQRCFYGYRDGGAFEKQADGNVRGIQVTAPAETPVRVVGSRSHRGELLDAYLAKLGEHEMVPMGSSLKLCLVALGEADVYPRLGLTSEWDTAAAQAVVECAGGRVVQTDGTSLLYNAKEDILNPHFIVYGDQGRDWTAYLS